MDFTKYVSLLSTKSLYFARADCFDDSFEGAKGFRKHKAKWDSSYMNFFREAIRHPPYESNLNLTEEQIEEQAIKLLESLETGGKQSKTRTYISCWHENEYESEAMWRLYSSFINNAVAVRTTHNNLYLALGRNPSISIGRVKYIDLNSGYAGINNAYWRKRNSFEHEKEVRAVITDHNCKDFGKQMSCDLSLLVQEVFVSPKAPNWFIDLVNDVNQKYDLMVKVSTSEMIEEPFF